MRKIFLYGMLAAAAALLSGCSSSKEEAASEEPVVPAAGETYLIPLQKRDSLLIADQLRYGFRLEGVESGEGAFTPLPEKAGALIPGIRQVGEGWQLDIRPREDGRCDIDAWLTITSFDEGAYELPPLGAVVGGDTTWFDGKRVEFVNCAVDTTKFMPENLRIPPTPIIRFPWTPGEKWTFAGLVGLILLGVGLLVLAVWLLLRHYRRKALAAEPDPAHIVALRKIDAYRSDSYWKPERQKTFYSGITDALKEYIGNRYGFDAPEMTSGEVLHHLKKETDLAPELRSGLGHLFEVADYVKFARHTADDSENARVVPFATGFVTQTWQQLLEAEAEKKQEEEGKA